MSKTKNKLNKISAKLITLFLVGFIASLTSHFSLLTSLVSAQTAPQFLVSWRAENYVPPAYQGKIFPGASSPVEIGFDLIDANKIVNLSKNQISWSSNGTPLQSGIGLKTVRFNSKNTGQSVRIIVSDYKRNDLDYVFEIPVFRPELALDIPSSDNRVGLGQITIKALPYFFNAANKLGLAFNWSYNGQPVPGTSENPSALTLTLKSEGAPKNADILISAVVQNIFNPLEIASRIINLSVTGL